jgi:hypothetical protein
VVADTGERRQRLGGDRVEEVGWVSEAKRELPPDREVELSFLFSRDLAIHVLHLRLEHFSVDKGARVCLWQRCRQRHFVLGDRISAHVDLRPGEIWKRQFRTNVDAAGER